MRNGQGGTPGTTRLASAEIVARDPCLSRISLSRISRISPDLPIFVNGRKLAGSFKWEQLKQIIDYQKIAQNAGDNCGCQISLSPLGVE
jgi:hypothetical protein